MTPSTPAPTDAGALAEALAIISGRCSVERDREIIIKAANALSNSAPQETRGDEPVAWRCRGEDGFYTSWFDGKPPNYYGPYEVAYAAPQQSPRLEREGIKVAVRSGFVKFGLVAVRELVDAIADAILALLSPDTTVVTSTSRGEVKE